MDKGREQLPPKSWSAIYMQPLHGNHLLTSKEGNIWGTDKETIYGKWSQRALIIHVGRLWKEDTSSWWTLQDLKEFRLRKS
jgi:hypothetical protein